MRLKRLKSEADFVVSNLGDEFRGILNPEELGFIEPSDTDVFSLRRTPESGDTMVAAHDRGVLSLRKEGGNPGALGTGVGLATAEGNVGSGFDGTRSLSVESAVVKRDVVVEGREGGTSAMMMPNVPKPRPMNIEECEWDKEGDCLPLLPWKVGSKLETGAESTLEVLDGRLPSLDRAGYIPSVHRQKNTKTGGGRGTS